MATVSIQLSVAMSSIWKKFTMAGFTELLSFCELVVLEWLAKENAIA